MKTIVCSTLPAEPDEGPSVTFRPLVAQGDGPGVPVTAGDTDVDGAVAGVVLLGAAAGLEEPAELAGVDGELDDDPQPAASATQISAATAWPIPGFPLPGRSRIGNTPTPPELVAPHAPSSKV
ncbi:MAG TPA: hypothetical protein VK284_02625 [Streptosporangiaceae bacterium]|nr:hypothetical protein [Streptosporangiaceae bacterium]